MDTNKNESPEKQLNDAEELKIRLDNNQSILLVGMIAIYKFFKHFNKIIK